MKDTLERLLKVTKDCREDMHEPDEQEVGAIVTGWRLDNAMGDDPYKNCCEFTVGITKYDGEDTRNSLPGCGQRHTNSVKTQTG